jgi:hypothetical protein
MKSSLLIFHAAERLGNIAVRLFGEKEEDWSTLNEPEKKYLLFSV